MCAAQSIPPKESFVDLSVDKLSKTLYYKSIRHDSDESMKGNNFMLRTVEGIYRNGTVELLESPDGILDDTIVIVTFLRSNQPAQVNLQERGIDEAQAAALRRRLITFTEDWESPEMEIYDSYDNNKRRL